jgi:LmbE family N-acetylglucosaminyl deacetylase
LGCPAALLHLRERGWRVVSLFASLGTDRAERGRRRAEALEASGRARFEPVFLDPPLELGADDDLPAAVARLADEVAAVAQASGATVVVSPSPHDVHHGHETVGRGVQRAMVALPETVRWWMWGLWAELPAPNVLYAFDDRMLDRAVHVLEAYGGELARNDYRRALRGRAAAAGVIGPERVFGFGSAGPGASGSASAGTLPYAELLTEVRWCRPSVESGSDSGSGSDSHPDGTGSKRDPSARTRFLASDPHRLDDGPERPGAYRLDVTAWVEAPSVRELLAPVSIPLPVRER